MVADSLEIFGNHQQVQNGVWLAGFVLQRLNQLLPNSEEQLIDRIIVPNDLLNQLKVSLNKGFDALCDHPDSRSCHLGDVQAVLLLDGVRYIPGQLCNIRCLVTDSLHIGNHLEGGRDHAQVLCHRLLLEQHPHTACLDVVFQLVNFMLQRKHPLYRGLAVPLQNLGGNRDCLLAQASHPNQLDLQLAQLLIKSCSHIL